MTQQGKVRALSANTLLFTISTFGTKIISFLFVPLYTYVLSTEDYGNLDLVNTTVHLLVPVLTLNIQDAVLRFGLDKEYEPLQIVKTGVRIAEIASAVLGIGLVIAYNIPFFHLSMMYSVYLFLLFIANVSSNILSMYLKAINKVRLLVISGIVSALTTCTLSVMLLLIFKMGVVGYLIANISGIVLSVIIMMVGGNILMARRISISPNLVRTMCLYSLPLIANTIAWWVNNASDRYILAFFCGAAVNGVYAIAYKIPTILSTVQNVFYNAWSISAITEYDRDDADGFIGNVYMSYSCVSLIFSSMIMILNVFLAKMLYAKDFFIAWRFVPPLLVGAVFNGIALFEGCLFTAVKKTKEISMTTLTGAAVNTVCNFSLIPFFGALGAATATMIGYMTIWIVRTLRMRKIISIKVNWTNQLISYLLIIIQCALAVRFKSFYYQIPIVICIFALQGKTAVKIGKTILNIKHK
jgi:O-antigen/teichoic acid export membrane protein